jgi:membrane fusion protein (multidrug efflux system)
MKVQYLFYCSLVIVLSGCWAKGSDETKHADVPALPVMELQAKDTIVDNNYVADIQAEQNVEIRSKVSGYLEKIYVDEGKEVKKGQPLFKINDQLYRIELAKAKAVLDDAVASADAAELELKRVQLLADRKVIAATEVELAKAKLNSAKAKIAEANTMEDEASLKLSYTLITSPFTGVIDRIPLKLGSLVDDGALLTTISDLSSVFAYFHVSENEYLRFFKKKDAVTPFANKVTLLLADGTVYAEKGNVETIDGEFDESTGSIAFRARFQNPNHLLKHGSTGNVSITKRLDDVLLVPQKAVFDIQDKNYVFVLGKGNMVKMQSFTPSSRLGQYYVVQEGLAAGDKIVVEGTQNIKDGSVIKPIM